MSKGFPRPNHHNEPVHSRAHRHGSRLKGVLPLYLQKRMEERAAARQIPPPALHKTMPAALPPPPVSPHSGTALPPKIMSPDDIIKNKTDNKVVRPHIPGRGHEDSIPERILFWGETLLETFPEFRKKWFWITVAILLTAGGLAAYKTHEHYRYRESPGWAVEELKKMGIAFLPQNFMKAVERNDRRAIDLFLKAKVDTNAAVTKDKTPLMIFAERGDYAKARLLVESGVDINFENGEGQSAISLALANRHIPIYRLLRQAGAKNIVDFFSAIKFADSLSIEELVTERFSPKDVDITKHPQLEEYEGKLRYRINQYDQSGGTPLIWAVMRGDVKTVELLLNNNADVNAPDKTEGQTPLMIAASNGLDPVMVPLIRYNANLNLRDKKGRTALFISVIQKKPSAVGILLAAGADPNIGERSQGLSVASAAAFLNQPPILAALVDSGADVLQPDYRGLAALEHASANGSIECIEVLIKKAGQVYLGREHNVISAIKIAQKQGNEKVVELLKQLSP